MQQQHVCNSDGLIRPAEYARLRGLNKSTVSRQIRAGKIRLRPDGRLHPDEADADRRENLHAIRGGRKFAEVPEALAYPDLELEAARLEGQFELLERMRNMAAIRLPELARRLKLPEHIALAAADVFDTLLSLVDADQELDDYEWPAPPTEPPRGSKALDRRADAFYTRLVVASEAVFIPAVLADPERYSRYVKWAREETEKKHEVSQKKRRNDV